MVTVAKNKKKNVEEEVEEAPKSRFFYEEEKDIGTWVFFTRY